MRSVLVLAMLAACTPRAVTPPARTLVMNSPRGPAVGGVDAQLDLSRIGTVWGPELVAGNARVRTTIQPGVTLEGDAGVLHVTNDGRGGDRAAYTGRAGVILSSEDGGAALMAGVGGGASAFAGSWGAVDVGAMVSGRHRSIRPVVAGSIGYAAPFDSSRTFTVEEPDGTPTELRLPRNVIANAGFVLELGPRHACALIGLSMTRFWLRESSVVGSAEVEDDAYFGLGVGARFEVE